MAGSHRATPTKQSAPVSKRAIVVAAVVALVPALWFGGHRVFDGSGSDKPGSSATVLPIPPVTTPATPTPSAPVTTKPAAPVTTRPPVQPSLPRVTADVPRRLLSKGLLNVGFDNSIEPTASGSFRAASTAEAARWGSRGEPGTPEKDTVYVVGKTLSSGVSAFDTLPQVKVGAKIVIRTDSGDLTYTVKTVKNQGASGLAKNAAFAAKVPGRLVVVGLRYDRSGRPTGQALVVTAFISGAVRR